MLCSSSFDPAKPATISGCKCDFGPFDERKLASQKVVLTSSKLGKHSVDGQDPFLEGKPYGIVSCTLSLCHNSFVDLLPQRLGDETPKDRIQRLYSEGTFP